MRRLLLIGALPVLLAAQDPREVVRRACELDNRNGDLSRNYTYLRRDVESDLDSSGKPKNTQINTYDITTQEGTPYRRLVARNDQPLSLQDQKNEDDKLQRDIAQRRGETPQQRARRIANYEKRRNQLREPLKELPDAFTFQLAGEETINGGEAWVIDATPRPGYKPKSLFAFFFPKVKGRLWIAKSDSHWIKVDMEFLDTASLGGFIVRVSKGSRIMIENTRVNDEIWLPKHIMVVAATRVMLVKGSRKSLDMTYSNYKKFQSDSRIISSEPMPR